MGASDQGGARSEVFFWVDAKGCLAQFLRSVGISREKSFQESTVFYVFLDLPFLIQFLADPSDEIHVEWYMIAGLSVHQWHLSRVTRSGLPPRVGLATHGFVEWIQPRGISKWRLVRAWALQELRGEKWELKDCYPPVN